MAHKLKVYSEDEAKARLAKELPHWYLEEGWIRRRYRTNSWKGTLMVINAVGHLAEAAWHHPDLTASYAWVEVRLMTHDHKGLTDKDFQLAKKIEEVVQWQPGLEGGALEGTPAGGSALRLRQVRPAQGLRRSPIAQPGGRRLRSDS